MTDITTAQSIQPILYIFNKNILFLSWNTIMFSSILVVERQTNMIFVICWFYEEIVVSRCVTLILSCSLSGKRFDWTISLSLREFITNLIRLWLRNLWKNICLNLKIIFHNLLRKRKSPSIAMNNAYIDLAHEILNVYIIMIKDIFITP